MDVQKLAPHNVPLELEAHGQLGRAPDSSGADAAKDLEGNICDCLGRRRQRHRDARKDAHLSKTGRHRNRLVPGNQHHNLRNGPISFTSVSEKPWHWAT